MVVIDEIKGSGQVNLVTLPNSDAQGCLITTVFLHDLAVASDPNQQRGVRHAYEGDDFARIRVVAAIRPAALMSKIGTFIELLLQ